MVSRVDVVDQARQRLGASSHLFCRCVRCEFDRGVLTLSGRVPSFYLKQTASALTSGIEGVRRVNNALEVAAEATAAPVG